MYTIILSNGKKIADLVKNGDNYVSKVNIDESIFDGNLSKMTVSDGESEKTYQDMVLVRQMPWPDGTYYLAFRQKTPQEKALERIATMETTTDDLVLMMAEIIGG